MAVPKDVAPRLIFNCVEGWGKTSLVAFIPEVRLILAPNETGYETLLGRGLVPSVQQIITQDWAELLAVVDAIIAAPGSCSVVALDALGGFEFLCHQHVCEREYKGVWGEKGFLGYMRGYDRSVTDWRTLLSRLDELRSRHGIASVFLSHAQVRPFTNPLGDDFKRFEADCHPKTWGVTGRWADAVLFGTYETVVSEDAQGRSTHKGIGKSHRILYAERRDAFDAKNRYAMPEMIHMTNEPEHSWGIVHNLIKGDANAS